MALAGETLPVSATLSGCRFRGNAGPDGGALTVSGAATAALSDSNFTSNVATSGSAVFVSDGASLAASACSFYNNTALGSSGTSAGGSVRALKGGRAAISGSRFARNAAAEGAVARVDAGSGLALTDCTASNNTAQRGALLSLAASSSVTLARFSATNNTALYGGFFFTDSAFAPPACDSCSLSNNVATVYGPLQATEPVSAALTAPALIRSGEPIPDLNLTMLDAFNSTVPRWPEVTWTFRVDGAGAELRGQLEVAYHAGAVGSVMLIGRVGASYTILAEMSAPSLPKMSGMVLSTTVRVAACEAGEVFDERYGACLCGAGSVRRTAAAAAGAVAALGAAQLASAAVVGTCEPCQPGTYSAQAGASVCSACPSGAVAGFGQSSCSQCPQASVPYNASACACARGSYVTGSECRTCPANSAVPADRPAAFSSADCVCVSGFFKMAPTSGNSSDPFVCQECPKGSYCPGNDLALAADGFWQPPDPNWGRHLPTRLPTFFPCKELACLRQRANGSVPLDNCGEGWGGVLCGACKKGYAMQAQVCIKCLPRSDWRNWGAGPQTVRAPIRCICIPSLPRRLLLPRDQLDVSSCLFAPLSRGALTPLLAPSPGCHPRRHRSRRRPRCRRPLPAALRARRSLRAEVAGPHPGVSLAAGRPMHGAGRFRRAHDHWKARPRPRRRAAEPVVVRRCGLPTLIFSAAHASFPADPHGFATHSVVSALLSFLLRSNKSEPLGETLNPMSHTCAPASPPLAALLASRSMRSIRDVSSNFPHAYELLRLHVLFLQMAISVINSTGTAFPKPFSTSMDRLSFFKLDVTDIPQGGCIQPDQTFLERSQAVIIGITVVWASIFVVWMPLGLLLARGMKLPQWRVDKFRRVCLSRVVAILTLTCAPFECLRLTFCGVVTVGNQRTEIPPASRSPDETFNIALMIPIADMCRFATKLRPPCRA